MPKNCSRGEASFKARGLGSGVALCGQVSLLDSYGVKNGAVFGIIW